jgi:hypothetical protein
MLIVGVLAGAYAGRGKRSAQSLDRPMLTHALPDNADKALCGLDSGSLSDLPTGDIPTCPRCAKRLANALHYVRQGDK